MAWSPQKNSIFFQRAQNWAAAMVNLLEERDRLIDLYQNEASPNETDDPDFVDTAIATKAELVELADVMNAVDAAINNGVVQQADRMPMLTPFLVDQE